MDSALVIVVLLAYLIRPQDWVPGLSGLNIMNLAMALALLAMFARRGGVSVSSLVKTPVDWAMLAYAIYIVWAAPSGQKPFVPVAIFLAYYAVTSQALSTAARLQTYLRCWLAGLLVVAAMAVASEFGLDLTGARELTHAVPEKPRLALNTYLFNNANSLGHSVIIAVPLAYLLWFWRRPLRLRLLALLAVALAAYCVYLTQSKGAYIIGFTVVMAAMLLGRPIFVQLIIVLLAATLGFEGLKQLPRMTDMERVRRDEAVMGRMLAWEQARLVSKQEPQGRGFKNFESVIEWENEELSKATHSSYVLVGAELGTWGMWFYLAVLYASLRSLATTRCSNEEDESSRRALLAILLGFMGSSWLIDRSYHLEYFFLAGAVSAFHRRLGIEGKVFVPLGKATPAATEPAGLPGTPALLAMVADGGTARGAGKPETIRRPSDVDTTEVVKSEVEALKFRFWFWRRWGVLDLVLVFFLTSLVFDIWDHILETYFL